MCNSFKYLTAQKCFWDSVYTGTIPPGGCLLYLEQPQVPGLIPLRGCLIYLEELQRPGVQSHVLLQIYDGRAAMFTTLYFLLVYNSPLTPPAIHFLSRGCGVMGGRGERESVSRVNLGLLELYHTQYWKWSGFPSNFKKVQCHGKLAVQCNKPSVKKLIKACIEPGRRLLD